METGGRSGAVLPLLTTLMCLRTALLTNMQHDFSAIEMGGAVGNGCDGEEYESVNHSATPEDSLLIENAFRSPGGLGVTDAGES